MCQEIFRTGPERIRNQEEHMTAIDLIVLGIVRQKALSAYDIQKLVEYRNISKWVKVSTPSIYKKVLRLEEAGHIKGTMVKGEKTVDKAVYSLTESGEAAFETLMLTLSAQPVHFFLDFNAVVVNLDSLSYKSRQICLDNIEHAIQTLKSSLEKNFREKESLTEVPETGKAVLRQQYILAEAIETWLYSVRKDPK